MNNMILIKQNLKHLLFLMCESRCPTLGPLFFLSTFISEGE